MQLGFTMIKRDTGYKDHRKISEKVGQIKMTIVKTGLSFEIFSFFHVLLLLH